MREEWQKRLVKRQELRKLNLEKDQPDAVRDILFRDLKNLVHGVTEENLEKLVAAVYYPTFDAKNPPFKALLAISDQLFVYSEYLQELLFSLSEDIVAIVPAKTYSPKRTPRKEKASIHTELTQVMELQEKLLAESPNKFAIYKLIDGEKSLTDLWEAFNKQQRDPKDEQNWVSKQYISQVVKELEQANLIVLKRVGKQKIPYKM